MCICRIDLQFVPINSEEKTNHRPSQTCPIAAKSSSWITETQKYLDTRSSHPARRFSNTLRTSCTHGFYLPAPWQASGWPQRLVSLARLTIFISFHAVIIRLPSHDSLIWYHSLARCSACADESAKEKTHAGGIWEGFQVCSTRELAFPRCKIQNAQ